MSVYREPGRPAVNLGDTADTSLIAELRSSLEAATNALAAWRKRGNDALTLAEQLGVRILELEEDSRRWMSDYYELNEHHAAGTSLLLERIWALEEQVEALRCGDLLAFADGELAPDRKEAYREHLGRCASCRAGLTENADLDARLSQMAAARRPR